jgi:hypothetical protein
MRLMPTPFFRALRIAAVQQGAPRLWGADDLVEHDAHDGRLAPGELAANVRRHAAVAPPSLDTFLRHQLPRRHAISTL